jgi:hypothetical protein
MKTWRFARMDSLMPCANAFSVKQWNAWSPVRESRTAWAAWASAGDGDSSAETPPLPAALRRRTTALGQKALAAALACGPVERGHYIFASRNGEYDRTVTIFDALAANEAPSPADFSMSVHHSLAGLLSVHSGNRAGHTAVAAGFDSFGFGLVEAVGVLAERPAESVLLVYYDESLPHPYERFRQGEETLPIVLALKLATARPDGDAISFSATPADGAHSSPSAVEDFLKFYLSGAAEGVSGGERMTWRWRRHA